MSKAQADAVADRLKRNARRWDTDPIPPTATEEEAVIRMGVAHDNWIVHMASADLLFGLIDDFAKQANGVVKLEPGETREHPPYWVGRTYSGRLIVGHYEHQIHEAIEEELTQGLNIAQELRESIEGGPEIEADHFGG